MAIVHIQSDQTNPQRLSWLKMNSVLKIKTRGAFLVLTPSLSPQSLEANEQTQEKRDMIDRGTERSLTINIICESNGWASEQRRQKWLGAPLPIVSFMSCGSRAEEKQIMSVIKGDAGWVHVQGQSHGGRQMRLTFSRVLAPRWHGRLAV